MPKQIVLTVPESQASLTKQRPMNFHVDLTTGVVHMTIDKCDNDGNVVTSIGAQWTLSPSELSDLTAIVIPSAQTAGQIPAGTVEDV